MIKWEDVLKIGYIQRVHGISGEVEMRFTDDVFDQSECDYLLLKIDGLLVPFFIEEYRFKNKDTLLVLFEGVEDESHARMLCGTEVWFPISAIPEERDLPLTWGFLTGFNVYDAQQKVIGKIEQVDTSSANTLLRVVRSDGKEVLLPLHPDFVVKLDEKARTLVLDLPEGLLTLNE